MGTLANGYAFASARIFRTKPLYKLSWWESLIVAAAEAAGCTTILSEDLGHGAHYFGIIVENPFRLIG